jgi:hypothetical protein
VTLIEYRSGLIPLLTQVHPGSLRGQLYVVPDRLKELAPNGLCATTAFGSLRAVALVRRAPLPVVIDGTGLLEVVEEDRLDVEEELDRRGTYAPDAAPCPTRRGSSPLPLYASSSRGSAAPEENSPRRCRDAIRAALRHIEQNNSSRGTATGIRTRVSGLRTRSGRPVSADLGAFGLVSAGGVRWSSLESGTKFGTKLPAQAGPDPSSRSGRDRLSRCRLP